MFFPLGDRPNPAGFTAWLNWTFITLNVVVYFLYASPLMGVSPDPQDPALQAWLRALSAETGLDARTLLTQVSAYDLFIWEHGFKPGAPAWDDLFSSMFLHSGFMHLAGNMLFLWIYGDNVEHRLGRLGYLLAYLGTGAAAVLGHALLSPGSLVPMVGASGAISGVLGMYFLMFPRNEVKVLALLLPFVLRVFYFSSRLVLGLYLVFDNLLPLLFGGGGSVAYGAHIGGFVAGLGLAWVGERMDWKPPLTGTFGESDDPEDLKRLQAALVLGDPAAASAALLRLHPDTLDALPLDDLLQLATQLQSAGMHSAAWRVLSGRLRHGLHGDEAAQLHLGMAELRLRQGQGAAAWQHILAAQEQAQDPALLDHAQRLAARLPGLMRQRTP